MQSTFLPRFIKFCQIVRKISLKGNVDARTQARRQHYAQMGTSFDAQWWSYIRSTLKVIIKLYLQNNSLGTKSNFKQTICWQSHVIGYLKWFCLISYFRSRNSIYVNTKCLVLNTRNENVFESISERQRRRKLRH